MNNAKLIYRYNDKITIVQVNSTLALFLNDTLERPLGALEEALATRCQTLAQERDTAIAERDYLVSEYERAVKCDPQGFAHAAGHLYNAISNAKCDVNAERFIAIQKERDAASYIEQLERRLKETLESEAELAAHIRRLQKAWDNAHGMPGISDCQIIQFIFNETPATALARRDLLQRAEELEEVAAQIGLLKPNQMSPVGLSVELKRRAKTKRKQAEELTK